MADILFVNTTDSHHLKHEVNGTLLLATLLLREGFDVAVLRAGTVPGWETDYEHFQSLAAEQILAHRPRCVCFYSLWPYYHVLLRLAERVKRAEPGIKIVFGGPQASFTARETMEAMDFVDYICTGEGEGTIIPFMDAILRQGGAGLDRIPGLYCRSGGQVTHSGLLVPLCDLNELPRWDMRLLEPEQETQQERAAPDYFMPLDEGRGCPFGCSFCCTSRFLRRTFRQKKPERIVADIRYLRDNFGIRSFAFTHDAFTTNQKLVNRVCDAILDSGLDITWKCTTRVDVLSEELILKMKRAGMRSIELGIESGSARMQKLIHKNLDLTRAKEMVSILLKNRIRVTLFFMYGFPEETEGDLNQTMEMLFSMLDMGVSHTSMSFCNFNPGTEITAKHFDRLRFAPEMDVLLRSVKFGYEEEQEMIRENKGMFPFFYHLDTPVRNEYQYVTFLVRLYEHFPMSIRHLRRLYEGDHLRFYRDYYEANRECFDQGIRHATDVLLNRPMEMVEPLLDKWDKPHIGVLRELMRFDLDRNQVRRAKEDCVLRRKYGFSYLDLHMKLPLEQFSPGSSELLLRKTGGKLEIKLLRLE